MLIYSAGQGLTELHVTCTCVLARQFYTIPYICFTKKYKDIVPDERGYSQHIFLISAQKPG